MKICFDPDGGKGNDIVTRIGDLLGQWLSTGGAAWSPRGESFGKAEDSPSQQRLTRPRMSIVSRFKHSVLGQLECTDSREKYAVFKAHVIKTKLRQGNLL